VLSKSFRSQKSKVFTERFETEPGQQAQFDLKERVKVIYENEEMVITHVATLTLGFSRYNVRRIVLDKSYDTVSAFLAEAFEEIGGVPKELVIDNIKCLVDKPRTDKDEATLNVKFIEFLKDYNIKCLPCMPYRPETKGKTETQNKVPSQLRNYNGTYKDILDVHDILEVINREDNESISQATHLPRTFLLEKEKDELSPLPPRRI
jgi:transposase